MFESIIFKTIIFSLSLLICNDQQGFFKYRSTATNQLVLQKFVLSIFATSSQVDVIFTDFAKAFNKVEHIILKSKIHFIGIRNPFLNFILSGVLPCHGRQG